MGFPFVPAAPLDQATPEAYFADYATQRREFVTGKSFQTVVDEEGVEQLVPVEVEEVQRIVVLEPKRRIEISSLGTSPKKLANAAASLGLSVSCWVVVLDIAPTLYKHDAKENSGKSHRAGDVLHEGYVGRRYTVEARHPTAALGFQAFYLGKVAEGNTASFEHARIADPLGIQVENHVDYTRAGQPGESAQDRERRIQEGMAMNRRINDGSMRTEKTRTFKSSGEFTVWLDDYLALAGLPTLTPKRRVRLTAEEKEAELLKGGEWGG